MRERVIALARSVRFRLTLWYVTILAVVLVAFSSAIYFIQARQLQEELDSRVRVQVADLVRIYNDQTGLLDVPGNYAVITPTVAILLTPQGQVVQSETIQQLAHVATTVSQQMPPSAGGSSSHLRYDEASDATANWLPGWEVAVVRIWQQHRIVALMVVAIPSTLSRQLADLALGFAVAIPIVLVLSTGGGYWLARHAMRPIQSITRTAQDISVTDLHRRLRIRRRDEFGELGATIDQMLERLEGAFLRQRQFTADASHELRTPLTIVSLQASRALEQPLTPQEYRQTLAVILQESASMSRLVNDLLTLARADSGQVSMTQDTLDLGEIIFDAVERLAPLAQQNGTAIAIAPLPEMAVQGDRDYLCQLFTNIIENALKHGQGIARQVQIAASLPINKGQPSVAIRVADDGPGIAPEHLPHLFDRFYQVDRARTHHQRTAGEAGSNGIGSGLGLAIAQWIVQDHHGTIQVQSHMGTGTVVTVTLPLKPVPQPVAP
jgi:two-component system, OmpR family, sensor kinase